MVPRRYRLSPCAALVVLVLVVNVSVLSSATPATHISIGSGYACYTLEGRLYCWGENFYGQLGQSSFQPLGDAAGEMTSLAPVQFPGNIENQHVLRANTGDRHTCATFASREMTCWGSLEYGKCATDSWTPNNGDLPGEMTDPLLISVVRAGQDSLTLSASTGYQHTCALFESGSLKCWGLGSAGELGHGKTTAMGECHTDGFCMKDITPIEFSVTGQEAPSEIVTGWRHNCVLFDDASVRCFGQNGYGQLGIGTALNMGDAGGETSQIPPVEFGNPETATEKVVQVALGVSHSCALFSHGKIKCWGRGNSGQLGNMINDNILDQSYTQENMTYIHFNDTTPATFVAAGGDTTCAIFGTDGRIRCWGYASGALGYGEASTVHYGTPGNNVSYVGFLEFSNTEPAVSIAVGTEKSNYNPIVCSVFSSGRVRCWGSGNEYTLGIPASAWIGDDVGELSTLSFIEVSHPMIVSLKPVAIPAGRALTIDVTVEPFIPVNLTEIAYHFEDFTTEDATYISPTQWRVTSPSYSIGTQNATKQFRIAVKGGADELTTVLIYTEPTVLSIAPLSGPTTGGTPLTITATNLGIDSHYDPKCCFSTDAINGMLMTPGTVTSDTTFTCTTPAFNASLVQNDFVNVTIALNGETCPTGGQQFYVYHEPSLTWHSVFPDVGVTAGGVNVTVNNTLLRPTADPVSVSLGQYVVVPATYTQGPNDELQLELTVPDVSSNGNVTAKEEIEVFVTVNGIQPIATGLKWRFYTSLLVLGLSPTSSPLQGGVSVTVAAANFLASSSAIARVQCAANTATVPLVVDADGVPVFTSPPMTEGGLGTVEFSLNGIEFTSFSTLFSYYNVSGITPSAGAVGGNTLVTIAGHGFQFTGPSLQCKFGTQTKPAFFSSSTALTCVSPAVPHNQTVEVRATVNGVDYTSNAVNYTYFELPTFSALRPSNIPATSNSANITLVGDNFANFGLQCQLGDAAARPAVMINDTAIMCSVPPSQGVVSLSFTQNDQDFVSTGFVVTYFTVVSFSPALGPSTGSTPVLIAGLGFDPSLTYTCKFGSIVVPGSVKNEGTMECITPPHAPGVVSLELSSDGITYTENNVTFTYYEPPVITELVPSADAEIGGQVVSITGLHMIPIKPESVRCLFGFKLGTTVYSNTSVLCRAPTSSGNSALEISLNEGYDYTSSGVFFAYTGTQSIVPARGPLAGGTSVSVSGRQFLTKFFTAGTAFCRFGTIVVKAERDADSGLRCTAPAFSGSTTVPFAITMGGGYTQVALTYEAYVSPVLTSFSPQGGPDSGGTMVTIIGQNLVPKDAGEMKCKWDVSTTPLTIISVSEARCSSPAQIGDVALTLTLNNQDYHPVGTFRFFSVSGMNPSGGPVAGNTEVFISGAGFIEGSNATCRVGGVVSPAIVANNGLVTCRTPPAPGSGNRFTALSFASRAIDSTIVQAPSTLAIVDRQILQLSLDNGNSYTVFSGPSAVTSFSYYDPLNVTDFYPRHGSTIGGTTITLTGRNFVDNGMMACRFGDSALDSPVPAKFVNDTQLVCVTSPHSIGNVSVFVSGNTQQFITSADKGLQFSYDACGFGTFAKVHTDPCTACPRGTFSNTPGAKQCKQCGSLSYADTEGSVKCLSCPEGTAVLAAGATNLTECTCKPGYYHPQGSTGAACTLCPEGAMCDGKTSLPITRAGYWRSETNQFAFIECAEPAACPGGVSEECDAGYTGRVCAVCEKGYYKTGHACEACPDRAWLLLLGFILLFIIIAFILFRAVDTESAYRYGQTMAIMIDFFQVLQLLGRLPLNWPPLVTTIIRWLTFVVVVDLDLFSVECSLPKIEWIDKWIFIVLMPVAIAVLFAVVYALARVYKMMCPPISKPPRSPSGDDLVRAAREAAEESGRNTPWYSRLKVWLVTPPDVDSMGDQMINAFVFFITVSYLVVVSATLSFFACERGPDEVWYMDANPSYICFGDWWLQYLPVGAIGVFFYVFLIPIGFVLWVQKNQSRLRDPSFARRYSSMYAEFRTEVPYWGVVMMIEKLVLATVEAFTTKYVQFTMMTILLALFIIVVLGYALQPFTEERNNFLEVIVRWCMCLLLLGGLLWHAGNFPQEFARTILLIVFLSIIAFAIFVAVYFVVMDVINIRAETRKFTDDEANALFRALACPNGLDLLRQWWQSYPDDAAVHDQAKDVLSGIINYRKLHDAESQGMTQTTASAASLHIMDNFTSYVFAPEVLPVINAWLASHCVVLVNSTDAEKKAKAEAAIHSFSNFFSAVAQFEGQSKQREREKFLPSWLLPQDPDLIGAHPDDSTEDTMSMRSSIELKVSGGSLKGKKKDGKLKSSTRDEKRRLQKLRHTINPSLQEAPRSLSKLAKRDPLASVLAEIYNFGTHFSELASSKVYLDSDKRGQHVHKKDRIIRRLHHAVTQATPLEDEPNWVPDPEDTEAMMLPLQALYNSDQDNDDDLDDATLPLSDIEGSDSDEDEMFELFVREMFGLASPSESLPTLSNDSNKNSAEDSGSTEGDESTAGSLQGVSRAKKSKQVLKVKVPVPAIIHDVSEESDDGLLGFSLSMPSLLSFGTLDPMAIPQYWQNQTPMTEELIKVRGPEFAAIRELVESSFRADLVGGGADNPNLNHTGVSVERVERVENAALWTSYSTYRSLVSRSYNEKRIPPVSIAFLDKNPTSIAARLDKSINETYLFHGTSRDVIPILCRSGFDERVSAPPNLFGEGVYFSEYSSKADEYSRPATDDGTCVMILSRVCLGVPFISHEAQPTMRRPPCFEGHSGRYVCTHPRFDSLIGDKGPHAVLKKYREFVIYRAQASYPEYVVTYRRTGVKGGALSSAASSDESAASSVSQVPSATSMTESGRNTDSES